MLQPTVDDKAIWKAVITSEGGWSHTFTLLRLAPALIWESAERPPPFSGTVKVVQKEAVSATAGRSTSPSGEAAAMTVNGRPSSAPVIPAATAASADGLDDLLELFTSPDNAHIRPSPPGNNEPKQALVQQESDAPATSPASASQERGSRPPPSGEHFMVWLRQHIDSRKLIINDAKALVHTVADTVYLVSPGLFQRYAQEHPQSAVFAKEDKVTDWQWVQKRFEKLDLHRKQENGLNIWTCEVTGPRKSRRLHGYLLNDPLRLFNDVPMNNPYLTVLPTINSAAQQMGSI